MPTFTPAARVLANREGTRGMAILRHSWWTRVLPDAYLQGDPFRA
jgi:hypothetical protein